MIASAKLKAALAAVASTVAAACLTAGVARGFVAQEPPGSEPAPTKDRQPPRGEKPEPAGTRRLASINFGPLRVGSAVELRAGMHLDVVGDAHDLAAKVVPPPFLKVKNLRIRDREFRGEPVHLVELSLTLDTGREADLMGEIRIQVGESRAELPVEARVLPKVAGLTKVLILSGGFDGDSEDFGESDGPGPYRTWFRLIEDARLDVSYIDLSREGLPREAETEDKNRETVPSDWLKSFDVVLLADGGPVFLSGDREAHLLQKYVRGGGRLIVGASDFMAGSVPEANRVLAPFGMQIEESEKWANDAKIGTGVFHVDIDSDPLTMGVKEVVFFRASPVVVTDKNRAHFLLRDQGSRRVGYAAVSRDGGEVIAIGPALLFSWAAEKGAPNDNIDLMRNLLTRLKPEKAARN